MSFPFATFPTTEAATMSDLSTSLYQAAETAKLRHSPATGLPQHLDIVFLSVWAANGGIFPAKPREQTRERPSLAPGLVARRVKGDPKPAQLGPGEAGAGRREAGVGCQAGHTHALAPRPGWLIEAPPIVYKTVKSRVHQRQSDERGEPSKERHTGTAEASPVTTGPATAPGTPAQTPGRLKLSRTGKHSLVLTVRKQRFDLRQTHVFFVFPSRTEGASRHVRRGRHHPETLIKVFEEKLLKIVVKAQNGTASCQKKRKLVGV
ncbi:hypothetical protein Bbelb_274890 [Branchiostoma belcheri]|nr:hypothetical protein Bbelb_274890 [Branchiostoma belcheri]